MTTRRVLLTRTRLFAAVFLGVGLFLFLRVPGAFAPDVISRMSFGSGPGAPLWAAPTRSVLLVIAALYVAGGLAGLIDRWPRLTLTMLLLDGLLIFPAILIGAAAGKQTNMLTMLAESLRLATPIVIGATAGIWAERSGVVNIAIEGMLLAGACFGFTAFFFLEPVMPGATNLALFLSVLVAVASGGLMALLHAWLSVTFKTNQIVSGTVINILAIGLTSFVRREWLLSTRAGRVTLPNVPIPLLSDLPIIGDVLFNNKPIFYMMFVMLIVTHVVLFYTALGLRMRAVGEHPEAADTVGINVFFTRYRNVIISGMIAGLGGAWFSLETVGSFDDMMTGGRGFIALAAMIFGKWTPIGAFGGGLLFGFADALGTRFQILNVPVPSQWLQMLPFITTMVVLAGLIGRAIPPAAVGEPYEKH
jgi:simple sugar transport system permease protein